MLERLRKQTAEIPYSENIKRLKEELEQAGAVLIGAGAGLSASAGFTYAGERFQKNFSDFEEKYGFHDMYSGGFYPFDGLNEYWAYWSRFIWLNRYTEPPRPVYQDLLELVKEKEYFVLTTNVDHCFQKAGFDKKRLFYTQGDYGLFQCMEPCCQETWDNEKAVREMLESQENMRIPSELVPHCPHCGRPMTMNLRADDSFVQDAGWHAACARYKNFIAQNSGKRVLFLELGVGMNTPGIIKYPFIDMTYRNKKARYACINAEDNFAPLEIEERSLCIKSDLNIICQLV